MIDAKTLKKHNLKAVPFSSIGEGETFYNLFPHEMGTAFWQRLERRLVGETVHFTSWKKSGLNPSYMIYTVYVPVWRPTK